MKTSLKILVTALMVVILSFSAVNQKGVDDCLSFYSEPSAWFFPENNSWFSNFRIFGIVSIVCAILALAIITFLGYDLLRVKSINWCCLLVFFCDLVILIFLFCLTFIPLTNGTFFFNDSAKSSWLATSSAGAWFNLLVIILAGVEGIIMCYWQLSQSHTKVEGR